MNFSGVKCLQSRFPRIIHRCHIGCVEGIVIHGVFSIFGYRIRWRRFTGSSGKDYRCLFVIPEIAEKGIIIYGKVKIAAVL